MTPTNADGQPVRLHRPETRDDADGTTSPGGSPWLFDGEDSSDSPVVSISPTVVRGAVLTLLVLLLLYALFTATVRGGRTGAEPRGVGISTSATPTSSPTASPTASASSAPTTASVAPPVSVPVVPAVDTGALEAWYDASGRPLLEDLASAVDDLQDYQDGDDTAELAAACGALGDVSSEAQVSRPPGYDTQIASDWDDAADSAARASRDCLQGIADDDEELLLAAAASAQRATDYARAVVDQVEDAID